MARQDYSMQKKCPVCYSSNTEEVTGEVEASITINILLQHLLKIESQEIIDSLLKKPESDTSEKY